jgi:hypothetical protein
MLYPVSSETSDSEMDLRRSNGLKSGVVLIACLRSVRVKRFTPCFLIFCRPYKNGQIWPRMATDGQIRPKMDKEFI